VSKNYTFALEKRTKATILMIRIARYKIRLNRRRGNAMNKKCLSYIIITLLCFNLLPQTSNAFKLNEAKTDVIYDSGEKEDWENVYLPYAKHLGLVNKATTVLDIVKKAEEEKNNDLIIEIMNRTHYSGAKLVIKWERDNKYVDEKLERKWEITPLVRKKLLTEIEEEEEREKEKTIQSISQGIKTILKIASAGVAFKLAIEKEEEWKKAAKKAAFYITATITVIEVVDFVRVWTWNKISRFWRGDEEIKLPPLQNMPTIPPNHTRVDVYSYGL
jgi:hypothetical protein